MSTMTKSTEKSQKIKKSPKNHKKKSQKLRIDAKFNLANLAIEAKVKLTVNLLTQFVELVHGAEFADHVMIFGGLVVGRRKRLL